MLLTMKGLTSSDDKSTNLLAGPSADSNVAQLMTHRGSRAEKVAGRTWQNELSRNYFPDTPRQRCGLVQNS